MFLTLPLIFQSFLDNLFPQIKNLNFLHQDVLAYIFGYVVSKFFEYFLVQISV